MKSVHALMAVVLVAVALVTAVAVAANGIDEGRRLVESSILCDNLTDDQLEAIGDYYMEQMHPGESHELMERMMGGEGSAQLRQAHISMARMLYCNESGSGMTGMMGGGMMNMMMGSGNMMGSEGMIGTGGYGSGYGMTGSYWNGGFSGALSSVLWLAVLAGLAILVWLWVIKLCKEVFGRRKR